MSKFDLPISLHIVEVEKEPDNASEDSGFFPETRCLTFDEYGDLGLLLAFPDGTEGTVLVSSSAMSLACRPWKKVVHPPFAATLNGYASESSTTDVNKRQISFREDNAEALIKLLRITHLQFNQVPDEMTFDELTNFTAVCNKYDCFRLARPWTSKWVDFVEKSHAVMEKGFEDWLFVAWAFGRDKSFNTLSRRLLMEVAIDEAYGICLRDGRPLSCRELPEAIEHILHVRKQVIERLLDVPYSCVRKYTNSPKEFVCEKSQNQKACDATAYGSLLRELGQIGLWPQIDAKSCFISVQELTSNLKEMNVLYTSRKGNHGYCALHDLGTVIDSIISATPDPVMESHRRHMEAARNRDVIETTPEGK